jgi:hypothetical protein
MVVGGYAVMLYTEPRYTKDLDIWVESTPDNAELVFRALAEFGAPLAGMSPGELGRKTIASFGELRAFFIDPADLIQNKRATGRPTDLVDCARLEEARKLRPDPD